MQESASKTPSPTAQGAFGTSAPQPTTLSGSATTLNTEQTLACPAPVEIILFGKKHWVKPVEFERAGAKFIDALTTEKSLLLQEITALRDAHEDLMNPPWYVHAGNVISATWETIVTQDSKKYWDEYVKVAHGPTPARFDHLTTFIRDQVVVPQASINEKEVLAIGKKLHIARQQIHEVRAEMRGQRELLIKQAGSTQAYVDLIEDTSVQVLMMAAEKASLSPVQELGYKITIMVLEGTVKTTAAAAAGLPMRSEFISVVRNRLPSILSAWLIRGLRNYMTNIGTSKRAQAVIATLAQSTVDTFLAIAVLLMDTGGRATRDDYVEILQVQLYNAIASVIAQVAGYSPESSIVRKAAGEIVSALAQTCAAELPGIQDAVKNEGRSYFEVIATRAPFLVARFAQQLFLSLIGRKEFRPDQPRMSDKTPHDTSRSPRVARLRQKLSAAIRSFHRTTETHRLPLLTLDEHAGTPRRTNLRIEVIEAMRALSHKQNLIQAVRIVKRAFIFHHGKAGMRPKPADVHAKTASDGIHEGKTVKPTKAEDLAKHWNASEQAKMRSAGILVRGDDLIFHPDMLTALARERPHLFEGGVSGAATVAEFLKKASAAGHLELGTPEARAWREAELSQLPAERRAAMERLLGTAEGTHDIGYYSDVDYVESVDATTGQRVPFDVGANGGAAGAARQNMERVGAAISEGAPRDEHGNLQSFQSLLQHGGAAEAITADGQRLLYPELGDVAVFLPDGTIRILEYPPLRQGISREEAVHESTATLLRAYEGLVVQYTGGAHQDRSARHQEAQTQPPELEALPTGAGSVTSKTPGELPRSEIPEDATPGERGPVVTVLDVQASLVARGLVLLHPENADWFARVFDSVTFIGLVSKVHQLHLVAGVDAERREIVLAARDDDGLAGVLARFGAADAALTRAGVRLRRWWEVVAPASLASWGGVAGALPDRPGVLATTSVPDTDRLSSAHPPKGRALQGFRAFRAVQSFSGDGDHAGALALDDVWRKNREGAFDIQPTKLGDRPVFLFRDPPVRLHADPDDVPAVIAPSWVLRYDLQSEAGLTAALRSIGVLERNAVVSAATLRDAIRRFQASELELTADGDAGPKTRAALREVLAEIEGDGVVASAAS